MHKRFKPYIAIILLSSTIIYCFAFPKAKYVSTDIFSHLEIPYKIDMWIGSDIEQNWKLEDEEYSYISQILEREYINENNKNLFLLLLNAGNFHNPKVCYNGAGFKVRELEDTELCVLDRTFKAHTLYAENDTEGYLLVYWMCIDKKIIDWTQQKIKQLWYSFLHEQNLGLMIRLDIPSSEDNIKDALVLAKEFISGLSKVLGTEEVKYLFGTSINRQLSIRKMSQDNLMNFGFCIPDK